MANFRPLMLLATLFVATPTLAETSDRDRVLSRLVTNLMVPTPKLAQIQALMQSQNPDGSWPNINYGDRTRGVWNPSNHLLRLREMARYGASNHWSDTSPPGLVVAIEKGLNFWLSRRPTSANWWYQKIGSPTTLGQLLILVQSQLSNSLSSSLAAEVKLQGRDQDQWTGANLTWIANNNFIVGVLTQDEALTTLGRHGFQKVFSSDGKDGIQVDWSFHQHGAMLQSGSYGLSVVSTMINFGSVVADTAWRLDASALEKLRGLVEEHLRWTNWKGYLDLSSVGRQLDQPNAFHRKATELADLTRRLGTLMPENAGSLQVAAQEFLGRAVQNIQVGGRFFWKSDYLVYKATDWTASVKMSSARVMRTETWVNHENRLGLHLGDGVLWLRTRGNEQADIPPLLDWQHLPGTTGPVDAGSVPPEASQEKFDANNGGKVRVGGLANGDYAIATMDFSRDGVSAQKTWFFVPNGIIGLGSNLADQKGRKLQTALNQVLLADRIIPLDSRSGLSISDRQGSANGVWVEGFAYFSLDDHKIEWRIDDRQSSWSMLNVASPSTPVHGQVAMLSLPDEHSGSYATAIVPVSDPQKAETAFRKLPRTVRNDSEVQAVESSDLLLAAFLGPGSLSGTSFPRVSVDRGCLLALSRNRRGLTLSISDPTQQARELHLIVGTGDLRLTLPQGQQAGTTMVVDLPDPGQMSSKE